MATLREAAPSAPDELGISGHSTLGYLSPVDYETAGAA